MFWNAFRIHHFPEDTLPEGRKAMQWLTQEQPLPREPVRRSAFDELITASLTWFWGKEVQGLRPVLTLP